ncbi:MAG: hypothetical protein KDK33_04940 [Leptospiraceae bacterium]|nr:hypothetical protein [Leptospiraceae bacterium]
MRLSLWICLALSIAPCGLLQANPLPLASNLDGPVVVPDSAVDAWIDVGGEATYPEVRNRPFTSLAGKGMSLGLHTGAVWIRFRLEGRIADARWLLSFSHPLFDELDIYIGDGHEFHTGRGRPFSTRPYADPGFVVPVEIAQGQVLEVYVRARSGDSIKFPVSLWKPEAFYQSASELRLIAGLYYGGILIILLYNFLLWTSLRERVYLVYSAYLFSIIVFVASLSGIINLAGLGSVPYLSERSVPIGMSFSLFFLNLFVLDFLDPGRYSQRALKINRIFTFLCLALLPTSFIPQYLWSVLAGMLLTVAYVPVLLWTAIKGVRHGFRPARIFLIAWSVLLFSVILFACTVPGWLPSNMATEMAIPVGLVIQVVLLSLGLADRIRELNDSLHKEQADLEASGQALRQMLGDASATAAELQDLSQKQSALVDQLSNMSSDQATASEEVAASIESIAAVTDRIHGSMESQSQAGVEMQRKVANLRSAHEGLLNQAQSSTASVEEMKEVFDQVQRNLSILQNHIAEIEQGGQSISGLVKVIGDITEKVNMLSLNASIEAARAGDLGRGFAVVADEVGKLAEQTGGRSREISQRVDQMQRSIDAGSHSAASTGEFVRRLADDIEKVRRSLHTMGESVEKQHSVVDELDRHAGDLNERSREIAVETADQVVSMREGKDTVHRISEMAGTLNATNQDLNDISLRLRERAESLAEAMKSR